MATFPRDPNHVPVVGGVLSTDGETPTPMEVTPNGEVKVLPSEVPPTDSSKLNASEVLGYDGSGNLITITDTVNGVSYRQTLTYTNNVLTAISAWVQL